LRFQDVALALEASISSARSGNDDSAGMNGSGHCFGSRTRQSQIHQVQRMLALGRIRADLNMEVNQTPVL